MNIILKNAEELAQMRIAGRLAAEVLEMIAPHVQAGISTGELDRICHNHIVNVQKAIPAPLNYHGFPKSVCISVNHVICHGIPDDKQLLKKGDIVNVDVTVIKNGWHGDTSAMFMIGEVPSHASRLCRITQECLYKAIGVIKPGEKLSRVGEVITEHAHGNHCSIVEEYCGHGIGKGFHEDPQVVHYNGYHRGNDCILQPGMTFTIEPMINAGKKETKLNKKDGWTVTTKDRRLSAQWEHTLAVTEDGCEILTLRKDEVSPF